MKKHPKPSSGNLHPQPKQHPGQESERKISGDIHVHGEVEANIPARVIEQYKTARQENTSRDNWRFFVEIVTLVIVAIYAGLTAWQAFSTQTIVELTRTQYTLDQRAWLGITEVSTPPDLQAGTVLNPSASLVNSGKTPAISVMRKAGYRILPASVPLNPGQEVSNQTPISLGVITPGGKRNLAIGDLGAVVKQRAEELSSGAFRLYLFGDISYNDVFGLRHHTRFCMRMELAKPYATVRSRWIFGKRIFCGIFPEMRPPPEIWV
jgi:hypothetical protein